LLKIESLDIFEAAACRYLWIKPRKNWKIRELFRNSFQGSSKPIQR